MIEVKYIHEESTTEFQQYIQKGLALAYSTDLVPEQKLVPFEYALKEVRTLVDGCDAIVVQDGTDGFAICCLAYSQPSHHKVGSGTVIQSMMSNKSVLTRKLLRIVKMMVRTHPDKQSWLFISKRVGVYTYQGQYYEMRNTT